MITPQRRTSSVGLSRRLSSSFIKQTGAPASISIDAPNPTRDEYASEFGTPPCTPPCSDSTFNPLAFAGVRRPGMMSRSSSSMSSVSSLCSEDEDRDQQEWTEEEKEMLRRTFESYCTQASTTESPFSASGPPPSNLTHLVARAVVSNGAPALRVLRSHARAKRTCSSDEAESSEDADAPPAQWRHGLKSTRAKLLSIVKERQSNNEVTPRQGDVDATPRKRRAPPMMVRQGSMDFLPLPTSRNVGIVARLGSKLHRAEQNGPPVSHPYAYPVRGRLNRAASLSSIAGSPSQPTPSSSRMYRAGSDVTSGHQFPGTALEYEQEYEPADFPSSPLSASIHTFPISASSSTNSLFPTSYSFEVPKKTGLGTAFGDEPHGTAYPSPVSSSKLKGKATLERSAGSMELSSAFEGSRSNLFEYETSSGRLPDNGFYFGSNGSISSIDSTSTAMTDDSGDDSTSTFSRHYGCSSSSIETLAMTLSTPSPRLSHVDLKSLSLDGEGKRLRDTAEGGAFLDDSYIQAGVDASESRERREGLDLPQRRRINY